MGRKNYDWATLKTEFVISDCKRLNEFAQVKGIPYDTLKQHTKGWLDAKANHAHQVNTGIEEADKESRILSLSQQREYLSGVVVGMLNQWRRLNTRLAQAEDQILKEGNEKITPGMRNQLRGDLNALTRLFPELVKTIELLAGRATERNISDSEETKARAADLRSDFAAIKDRFKKLAGRVKEKGAGNAKKETPKNEL